MAEQTTDKPTLKRRIPIPFWQLVPANASIGLASDGIWFPYIVTKVEAHFPDDANHNLQCWAFVSRNRQIGTAPPPDNKILGFYSPTPYLLGSGEVVSVDVQVVPDEEEKHLKVFWTNANAYAVVGYAIIWIETAEGVTTEQASIIQQTSDERQYSYDDWRGIYSNQAHAVQDQTIENLKGSLAWLNMEAMKNLRGEGETSETWDVMSMALATMTRYYTPDMHIDDFLPKLQQWFRNANLLMTLYNAAESATDISSIGQLNFMKYLVDRDEKVWGITKEMGRINEITYDASMNKYTEYSANWHFQAKIPQVADLINMVVKEKITLDYFKEQMRKQGYTYDWSQKIWDAHYIAPDYGSIRQAYWRGAITDAEIEGFMKLVDLDPAYNDKVWKPLLEEIPPYSELVNERVKEVITDAEFAKALGYWGYKGVWAERIWNAHFMPATFGDFLTAMRRKETVVVPKAEGGVVSHTFGADASKDLDYQPNLLQHLCCVVHKR